MGTGELIGIIGFRLNEIFAIEWGKTFRGIVFNNFLFNINFAGLTSSLEGGRGFLTRQALSSFPK